MIELARLARRDTGLIEAALPVMRELCRQTQETVLLTRRVRERVICLERVEASGPVRISYEPGSTLPVHAGASALVLLAWMAREEARAILKAATLERFTESTVTDVDLLMARLEQIRLSGFQVMRSELDLQIVSIAAPVCDSSGEVVAAISVAALAARVPDARVGEIVDAVKTAAGAVGRELGLGRG